MYDDLVKKEWPSNEGSIIQTTTLPVISFNSDDGKPFASIGVNEEGKIEIQTHMDFAEAGKGSGKVFWECFSSYLTEEWNKWVKQNPLNT